MKNIEIHYNPYKMITTMHIEGIDVCQSRDYSNIRRFIEQGTPLQTWIEPIPYLGWNGFVDEISDPENNDEVRIIFSGRKIDFQDLQHAIEEQNASRSEGTRVKYHYEHKKVLDDKKQNIDEVVRELKSDRFRKLVEQRTAVDLNERYRDLDKNYKTATAEFYESKAKKEWARFKNSEENGESECEKWEHYKTSQECYVKAKEYKEKGKQVWEKLNITRES